MPILSKVKLSFRSLDHVAMDFTSPDDGVPARCLAITGANGSGKSSVLDCIAEVIAERCEPRSADAGFDHLPIVLTFADGTVLAASGRGSYIHDTYGSASHADDYKLSTLYVRAGYLPTLPGGAQLQPANKADLSPDLTLRALTPNAIAKRVYAVHQWWLHQHWEYPRTAQLDRLWTALEPFLGGRVYTGINPQNHLPQFHSGGTMVSFNELSSGERRMIILFIEVVMHCGSDGLLLLDEPEAHLHPRWQRMLPQALTSLIPDGQVIFATHSSHITETLAPHQCIDLDALLA